MTTSKPRKSKAKLEVLQPDCAGIDIGGSRHYVAVRGDVAEESVQGFGCYTRDLHAMAD